MSPIEVMRTEPKHPGVQREQATVLVERATRDPSSADALLTLLYDELRRLASARLAKEPPGRTLDPTALVHEAYLRLLGPQGETLRWASRAHFFGAAARAMRRILIDRARRRAAPKHGAGRQREGGVSRIALTTEPETPDIDLLALEEALTRLEQYDQRMASIVMLRYFAGLSIEQTAAALDVSPTTVKSDWAFARAWLHSEIGDDTER